MKKRAKFNLKHPSTPKEMSTEENILKQNNFMKSELGEIYREMNLQANKIIQSYKRRPATSGSNDTIIQVHEESPILDEKDKIWENL